MSQLLSNLTTGAKVKFGSYKVNSEAALPVIWTVVAKNHSGYPTNAITLHTAGIIDLRCFDAKEPNNTNSDRQNYGNNRYSVANIDHWLNSNAAANAWYAAQHTYDQSPDTSDRCGGYGTQYAARPGFLNLFTTAEQNAILTTTLRVVKPSADGGSYEDIARKVFFPSTTEVGLANENSIAEGSTWGYYTSNALRIAYLTQQAFSNSPSSSKPSAVTSPWYWWLRTPLCSTAYLARFVYTDGSLRSYSAYIGNRGVRPALNLSSSLLVSDSTDSDGCYTFVWNSAPTKPSSINVPTSIYGGRTASISWGASTDPDGNLAGYILQRSVDSSTWTEVYRGTALTYTDSITFGWTTVAYRVCAYDTVGAQSEYETSATRNVTSFSVQMLSNLPIGAKVKFGNHKVNSEAALPIIWQIVAKGHSGYPAGSITLHAEKIIDLRCFDAKEPDNSNSDRQSYGNNRYSISNINQWLNKDSAAGQWYVAQHGSDQSPNAANVNYNTPYDALPGFLNNFNADERNAIQPTNLRVVKPSVDGGGYEDISQKVFLPSTTEVGLANEDDTAEGAVWGFYTSDADRIAYLTAQAFNNTQSTSKPSAVGTAWDWWLRTPYYSTAYLARRVGAGGSLGTGIAYYGNYGVRPALNLSSSLLVSGSTDSDGCYTFVWNSAPTKPSSINVPTSVYGGRTASISWGASTDPDGNLAGYILQRSVDSSTWTEVYRGTALTYTDSITFGWTTVAYRVCAYDTVGAQSEYETSTPRAVINNQAPVISGSDSNIGVKTDEFTQTYTVTDADSDAVTATERIDGVSIRSYAVTLGATNTFSVTDTTWLKQSNGSHTMTITAVDAFGNSAVRTYTFTKTVTSFSVQNTTPMTSDTRPARIKLSVGRNIPAEASFTVYVCNNGFDASPTWEDATTSVTGSLIHIFENTAKVAATWGVIIKVEVSRNTADGACYVSQIGGNFE